jgi:hypothetical protein
MNLGGGGNCAFHTPTLPRGCDSFCGVKPFITFFWALTYLAHLKLTGFGSAVPSPQRFPRPCVKIDPHNRPARRFPFGPICVGHIRTFGLSLDAIQDDSPRCTRSGVVQPLRSEANLLCRHDFALGRKGLVTRKCHSFSFRDGLFSWSARTVRFARGEDVDSHADQDKTHAGHPVPGLPVRLSRSVPHDGSLRATLRRTSGG